MTDYFDRVERQIVRRVEERVPRSTSLPSVGAYLATAAAVLVVIVVAGVFLLARGAGGGANPSTAATAGPRVVFSVDRDTPPAVIERSARILGQRMRNAVPGALVAVTGRQIVVTAAKASAGARSRIIALAAPGVLTFYDWEGQVVAPNGRTVASQLPSPSPDVLNISQGNGPAAPGELGAGCVPLQQALALSARLGAGREKRTEYVDGRRLEVPIGYTVLEAASAQPGGPTDGFFVVRNRPVLSGRDVTNPRASTDPNTRAPDLTFGFTVAGRRAFETVTAAVARRGSQLSSPGQTLNQHFAIALDNKLLSVPFIDFKQYPDGISGDSGALVSAGPTVQSARNLATLLRYGPLPVNLTATG